MRPQGLGGGWRRVDNAGDALVEDHSFAGFERSFFSQPSLDTQQIDHRLSLVAGKVSWSSAHIVVSDEPAAVWAAVHTANKSYNAPTTKAFSQAKWIS